MTPDELYCVLDVETIEQTLDAAELTEAIETAPPGHPAIPLLFSKDPWVIAGITDRQFSQIDFYTDLCFSYHPEVFLHTTVWEYAYLATKTIDSIISQATDPEVLTAACLQTNVSAQAVAAAWPTIETNLTKQELDVFLQQFFKLAHVYHEPIKTLGFKSSNIEIQHALLSSPNRFSKEDFLFFATSADPEIRLKALTKGFSYDMFTVDDDLSCFLNDSSSEIRQQYVFLLAKAQALFNGKKPVDIDGDELMSSVAQPQHLMSDKLFGGTEEDYITLLATTNLPDPAAELALTGVKQAIQGFFIRQKIASLEGEQKAAAEQLYATDGFEGWSNEFEQLVKLASSPRKVFKPATLPQKTSLNSRSR